MAIAWYIVHIKYYRPKPDVEDKVSESEARGIKKNYRKILFVT